MFKWIFVLILLNLCFVSAVEFSISSTPSNAKVWIDGNYTHHVTPTDEVEQKDVIELWTEGKHTLKLVKSGYLLEQEIELVAGQRLVLDLVIPEITDNGSDDESPSDSGSDDSSCDCPSCPKCEECPEPTIEYVEKIVYIENKSCEIENVIKPITGNIVYKTDNKPKRYGLYLFCLILGLMVVALYAKGKYYNKSYN